MNFSKRSIDNLTGVHPDLVKVALEAIKTTTVDFAVTDGLRTAAEQAAFYAKGASKTLKSRHLTGHAIDVCAMIQGKARWDAHLYEEISHAFFDASHKLNIPIRWGGDWDGDPKTKNQFNDYAHFELHPSTYP